MPLYQYACTTCAAELTKLQRMSDPPPLCPKDSNHGQMSKQVTAATFQLIGFGWYQSDFKSK